MKLFVEKIDKITDISCEKCSEVHTFTSIIITIDDKVKDSLKSALKTKHLILEFCIYIYSSEYSNIRQKCLFEIQKIQILYLIKSYDMSLQS